MKIRDLTGMKFGKLKALTRQSVGKRSFWNCTCDCGNITTVQTSKLINGNTRSCGCLRLEIHTKHKKTSTPEYRVWIYMKRRCENPRDPSFFRYGGRGIGVSESWHSFENFLRDMGERPTPKHTIERIDNDAGYSKDNCKWATRLEQARNHGIRRDSTTGITGVHKTKDGQFFARISMLTGAKYLGKFATREDAVEARKLAEKLYWQAEEVPKNQ